MNDLAIPVLAIDAGNTRVKWGLRVGDDWIANGAIATKDASKLGRDWPAMPPETRALGSNVGGLAVQTRVYEACARHDLLLSLIDSRRRAARCHQRLPGSRATRHGPLGRAHRRAP